MADMAQRIKERRLAMNYTQEELANKLGLQKSAVAKYENGRVENIKRGIISKMAEVLECNPAYLMGWDDELNFDSDNEDALLISRLATNMKPEDRKRLIEMAKIMLIENT